MAQTNDEFELTRSQLKRRNKKWQTAIESVWEAYLKAHPNVFKLWEIKINDVLAWNAEQCDNPTALDDTPAILSDGNRGS